MKNNERQRSLDKKKWLLSEHFGFDTSGDMDYCHYCEKCVDLSYGFICNATQEERESQCLCAKAYNRMVRSKQKNDY